MRLGELGQVCLIEGTHRRCWGGGCALLFGSVSGIIVVFAASFAGEGVLMIGRKVGADPFNLLVLAALGAPMPVAAIVFVDFIGMTRWFEIPLWFRGMLLVSMLFAMLFLGIPILLGL